MTELIFGIVAGVAIATALAQIIFDHTSEFDGSSDDKS